MEKVYKYTVTNQEIMENIFKHEEILMNHVVIPPGKVFPEHPTDGVVYVLIIRGKLRATIGGKEEKTYTRGQLVNIPKGVETRLGNGGDVPLELFVVKHMYD